MNVIKLFEDYNEFDMLRLTTVEASEILIREIKHGDNSLFEQIKKLITWSPVNVNYQDNSGNSPLLLAVELWSRDCIEMLLEIPEINVNLGDNLMRTPLMKACLTDIPTLVEILLQHPNIDINKKDCFGYTAWDHSSNGIRNLFPKLQPIETKE